jgi:hypothetical protein
MGNRPDNIMKRLLNIFLLLSSTASVTIAVPDSLFVAPDGTDSNPGTEQAPFLTVQRARDAIRQLKRSNSIPRNGIEVVFKPGNYALAQPLLLRAEDSGTRNHPIVYRAMERGSVRLHGGAMVKQWRKVEDTAVLQQLAPDAREHLLQSDLSATGLKDFGPASHGGLELFFNAVPMQIARWPNQGFVRIKDMVGDAVHVDRYIKHLKGTFVYEDERPGRWLKEKDAWLHGYWFHDWSEQSMRIAQIEPTKKHITLEPPEHHYGYRKGQWYFAFNLLSEIDQPGEWYLNRETGILYLWPPSPITEGNALVSMIPTLVDLDGASYIQLKGFIFEACRSKAIRLRNGMQNRIDTCTIRNTGERGIEISGGGLSTVSRCEIYQTGGGGITVNAGDRKTLTPAHHVIEHNHIHHYARIQRTYTPGISLNGVGNRAAHNLIHNAPHMGMGFGGNDHIIEYNEIHHVCTESNDAGAIYAGRDWTARGHILRHNYLHHVSGFENKGAVGIYLDDCFSSATITGNIFYDVTRAVMIGGGRDTTIENNIFVACKPAIWVDGRGVGWANRYIVPDGGWHMQEKLAKANHKQPPYATRYPALANILNDEPYRPKGNRIARNIIQGGKWIETRDESRDLIDLESNFEDDPTVFEDPSDPVATNFKLSTNAGPLKSGFHPIPWLKIGPQP